MKITTDELRVALDGVVVAPGDENSYISDGYMCDLLSFVIGRAPAGSAWITVIGNINTVAVAVLAEIPCIVLAENSELDPEALTRAKENDIAVIKTQKSAFDCAVTLGRLLSK